MDGNIFGLRSSVPKRCAETSFSAIGAAKPAVVLQAPADIGPPITILETSATTQSNLQILLSDSPYSDSKEAYAKFKRE
jgi:hypothetical protein